MSHGMSAPYIVIKIAETYLSVQMFCLRLPLSTKSPTEDIPKEPAFLMMALIKAVAMPCLR